MNRIPLRDGKTTPEFVAGVLSVFGNNPHRQPNFRLIWSERKAIWFQGEVVPEYEYLPVPCWVLETWLEPIKFAGPRARWDKAHEAAMGPYPAKGEYALTEGGVMPSDWYPNEIAVQALAAGITASREIALAEREKAIRENLEHREALVKKAILGEMLEMQDSGSKGIIQQSVSGPRNTFRTPDDYGRDMERAAVKVKNLPRRGGKLV